METVQQTPAAETSVVLPATRLRLLIACGVLLVGMLIVLYPITRNAVTFRDYPAHIQFTIEMQNGSIPILTHPLFHFALIVTQWVANLSWENAAVLVALVVQCALALSIFGVVSHRLPQRNISLLISVGLTFVLMLVAAITFFTWERERLYFGYLLPHVYHNPTTLILQPLSLLSFVYAVGIFSETKHFKSNAAWMISAVLVLGSALAKPNYIIAIVPAVGLYGLYRLVTRGVGSLNWKLAILGVALPAGLILLVQFALLPNSGSGADKIALLPFAFLEKREALDLWLLQLGMSLAFPLVVYALNFNAARQQVSLNLAWLAAAAALFYYYFVVETNRVGAGNFTWSAQIMALILFVFSARFLIEQIHQTRRLTLRDALCIGILLLHFVCGVVWYVLNLSPPDAKLYF